MKTHIKIFLIILSISLVSCHKKLNVIQPPGISTLEVTDITATTAVCGGELEYLSNDVSSFGMSWWTEQDTVTGSIYVDYKNELRFSHEMTGLIPNTKYYVQVFVDAAKDGVFGDMKAGETKEFTTLPE
jgi:predicted RNA-binding protein (virulence factor B family)